MDWFSEAADLDAAQAAWFARGMRRVAQADGMVHDREMNLIAAFEAGLEPGAEAARPTMPEPVAVAYVRSLIMVALADGVIGDAELQEIRTLTEESELDPAVVDGEILTVKRWFLGVFAGVDVFRDAVVRVAEDLGLPESEVDALRQEA